MTHAIESILALAGTVAVGAIVYIAGVRLFAPAEFSYFLAHARGFLPARSMQAPVR
jgi:hypothetical protein